MEVDFLACRNLEIWIGDRRGYTDRCIPEGGRAEQWGIRLPDGAVFAAPGAPTARPRVEVQRLPAPEGALAARVRVELPEAPRAFTVVYGDGDDGRSQERLIATSALRFGVPAILGGDFPVDPVEATCARPRTARSSPLPSPGMCPTSR